MFNYFRGWKHKLGLTTLALSCVILGAWLRSYSDADVLRLRVTDNTRAAKQHSPPETDYLFPVCIFA